MVKKRSLQIEADVLWVGVDMVGRVNGVVNIEKNRFFFILIDLWNGCIFFKDFLIAISVTAQGDAKKKLVLAFKMYDVDKNEKVDKKEMETIIECLYDLVGEEHRKGENSPSQRVKTIMGKLDNDHNGFLNEEEFVEGCLSDSILRSLLAPNAWFPKSCLNNCAFLDL